MIMHLKLINNEIVNDSTLHFFHYWRWVVMIWNNLMVLSTLSKRNKRYRLSDINLHDKFVCQNQISKFVFRFWRNSFIFFKDKQMNYINTFIKTKTIFKEVINVLIIFSEMIFVILWRKWSIWLWKNEFECSLIWFITQTDSKCNWMNFLFHFYCFYHL